MSEFESWGRFPKAPARTTHLPSWLSECEPLLRSSVGSVLPYGQGRSYGDCCLNQDGALLGTARLNRFISFDDRTGLIRCEGGVTLAAILDFAVPRGWFVPVTPGTKFVSVGGAIANDVHGKNHHRAGTFGRHVPRFELLRSTGERRICSAQENESLYRATIAGMGLTGLITWAEVQLKRIKNPFIEMESIKFSNLDEFFEISLDSDKKFEYTVAWLDCVHSGEQFGRGIFMRGNHSERDGSALPAFKAPRPKAFVPIDAPAWALNSLSVSAFNTAYYHKQRQKVVHTTVSYDPFFYPLDAVLGWNKIYGKRGFVQFQCVVPSEGAKNPIHTILRTIIDSKRGSFLAVLKEFGDISSPGMMSFPRRGVTLCLDFPFEGARTIELMQNLDTQVREYGGALYPAKDALMTPGSFMQYYPRWKEFSSFIDPKFSSSFWRRVTAA